MRKICVIVFLLTSIHFSCSESQKKIVKVAQVDFRRSYTATENTTPKQMDSFKKLNPKIVGYDNSDIVTRLKNYGIIKNERFDSTTLKWQYSDIINDIKRYEYQNCKVYYDEKNNCQTLQIEHDDNILTYNLKVESPALFSTIDENDKLYVVLDRYYIMNGDNYNLQIFKVE
jgi:hypothetical protein